ncbi:MAG: class I mannose-6-phosphate isomerase [Acidimicrobiia bacterium]|nr:class I mannose-6-phosphate isomerase [Acidimicrobiia bacterium]
MKVSDPLALEPILVPKPWGGHRLEGLGKALPDGLPAGTTYGESWEVADLPDDALSASTRGRTLVAGGPHRGKSLRQLIVESGSELLGSASPTPAGDFPLLVKLLDTAEHLSIQVHPDEEYAARRRGWFPKTESWYVLDAAPGASIFKGFRPGVTMEDVRAAAGTPRLSRLLQRIPVGRGDFHHLPAGTVHATVAEVQTPSDTTFRLYDWTEEYRRPERPLHVEDALGVLAGEHQPALSMSPMDSNGSRLLVSTPHYWIREHRLAKGDSPALVRKPELRILMVTRGSASVGNENALPGGVSAGGTTLIPAARALSAVVTSEEGTTLLEIGLVAAA